MHAARGTRHLLRLALAHRQRWITKARRLHEDARMDKKMTKSATSRVALFWLGATSLSHTPPQITPSAGPLRGGG
jgi:hypothetical protein